MFVGTLYEKKTGRTKLKIVEGYRAEGKVKQRMIKDLGYLDELEKQFDNPIEYFRAIARQMTAEKNRARETVQVMIPVHSTLAKQEKLVPEKLPRKNIGYGALSMLYHQLKIDYFLNNRRRYKKFEANLNSIFKMLIFNRALFPDSKRKAWEKRGFFFEDSHCSLVDAYPSLAYSIHWRPDL